MTRIESTGEIQLDEGAATNGSPNPGAGTVPTLKARLGESMAFLIGLALAISTGDILFGILSGAAWASFAHSLIGIVVALVAIGGLAGIFGISL